MPIGSTRVPISNFLRSPHQWVFTPSARWRIRCWIWSLLESVMVDGLDPAVGVRSGGELRWRFLEGDIAETGGCCRDLRGELLVAGDQLRGTVAEIGGMSLGLGPPRSLNDGRASGLPIGDRQGLPDAKPSLFGVCNGIQRLLLRTVLLFSAIAGDRRRLLKLRGKPTNLYQIMPGALHRRIPRLSFPVGSGQLPVAVIEGGLPPLSFGYPVVGCLGQMVDVPIANLRQARQPIGGHLHFQPADPSRRFDFLLNISGICCADLDARGLHPRGQRRPRRRSVSVHRLYCCRARLARQPCTRRRTADQLSSRCLKPIGRRPKIIDADSKLVVHASSLLRQRKRNTSQFDSDTENRRAHRLPSGRIPAYSNLKYVDCVTSPRMPWANRHLSAGFRIHQTPRQRRIGIQSLTAQHQISCAPTTYPSCHADRAAGARNQTEA